MKKIALIGDSLTCGYYWQNIFPDKKVSNYGVCGETILQILKRLPNVLLTEPDMLFVMMGINDLGCGISSEYMLANYERFIDEIFTKSPKTQLIVQSLLPVNKTLFHNNLFKEEDILEVNDELKVICDRKKIPFIDLYSKMTVLGNILNPEFTNDGLHLTEKAYEVWAETVQLTVNSLSVSS